MDHLDIHTRQELENFLSVQDPDFRAKWIAEDDERSAIDEILRMNGELEQIRAGLEEEREFDVTRDPENLDLSSRVQRIQKELGAPALPELRRYFLEHELELCANELARRRMQRPGHEKGDGSRAKGGG